MRAYLVTGGGLTRVAGTNADARATRDDIVEKAKVKKSQVSINNHEVPVAKGQLIEYLNELYAKLDGKE